MYIKKIFMGFILEFLTCEPSSTMRRFVQVGQKYSMSLLHLSV